jgi:hypothetical protein
MADTIERFRIARGDIDRPGPGMFVAIGAVAAVIVGGILAVQYLHTSTIVLAISGTCAAAALLLWANLAGSLEIRADEILLDQRHQKRTVPLAEISDAPTYAESKLGKQFVGVRLELANGTSIRVLIGEDSTDANARAKKLSEAILARLPKKAENEG